MALHLHWPLDYAREVISVLASSLVVVFCDTVFTYIYPLTLKENMRNTHVPLWSQRILPGDVFIS